MNNTLPALCVFLGVLGLQSCCTPRLNTSGKLAEIGKTHEGFESKLPNAVYRKNGVLYAEVRKETFSRTAPLLETTFCPDAGADGYEVVTDTAEGSRLYYFPLMTTQGSLPMSKELYLAQLKAGHSMLIPGDQFDRSQAIRVPVSKVISDKKASTLQMQAESEKPVVTQTNTTPTHSLMSPLVALDALVVDTPLTLAGGVPLAIGGALYKGGEYVAVKTASLFSSEEVSSQPEGQEVVSSEESNAIEVLAPAAPIAPTPSSEADSVQTEVPQEAH